MRRLIIGALACALVMFAAAHAQAAEEAAAKPGASVKAPAKPGAMDPIRMPLDKSDWTKSTPEMVGKIPFRTVSPAVTVSMGQKTPIMVGLGNVKALAFLISSGGDLPRDTTIAKMTMTCASGKEQMLALTTGATTYYRSAELKGLPKSKAGNYRTIWTNPNPADAILMITFADVGQTGCETRCEAITAKSTEAGFAKVSREEMEKALKGKVQDEEEDW